MGALARLFAQPTPKLKPDLARTRPRDADSKPRLGLTLLRPLRKSGARSLSMFVALPDEVLLLDDGIAVALYPDDGAVQYECLDELLDDHGMTLDDLEIVERVPGLGRFDP